MTALFKTGCPDCGATGSAHYANCRIVDKDEIAPVMPAPEWYTEHMADGSPAGVDEALMRESVNAAIAHDDRKADALAAEFKAVLEMAVAPPDIKAAVADEAKRIVSGARRAAYGTPEDNFERIARFWQAYFENTGRPEAAISAADVSPLMRLMKEARLCETPNHYDSFVDLVGYTLTGAEVNGVKQPSSA